MILSDSEITREIQCGDLDVDPFDESNVQPASLDIRLGNEFQRFYAGGPLNPLEDTAKTRPEIVEPGNTFSLAPGEFCLGTTSETVELPNDILANVEGRSSWGRNGLAIHITAGVIDPGFRGQITLELKNHNHMPLELEPGTRVGQLVFNRLSNPCNVPYGSERGSQYQDQRGAQPDRLHESGD